MVCRLHGQGRREIGVVVSKAAERTLETAADRVSVAGLEVAGPMGEALYTICKSAYP
jgi:hypothetical protein